MENIAAVKIDGLTKMFGKTEVIKNCSMNIPAGSVYGLLGVNGAGKTTIFKLIMGLLKPSSGTVKVMGMDTASEQQKILAGIGSLIETPVFYEHLSAQDNLQIHLEYMNTKGDISAALTSVGLKPSSGQPVSKFSLGMRQRLGIARALIHQPKLLILDEPINGLDPIGIREMRELFLRLKNERNITILISSHILNEIEHTADTIGVIMDGAVCHEVSMKDMKQRFPNGLEDYFFNIMSGGGNVA